MYNIPKKGRCLAMVAGLALPVVCQAAGQHLECADPFAPSENLVKPCEQAYRQELCLNGLWQFQPVTLPEGFREGQDAAPNLTAPKSEGWDPIPIRIPSPWNVNGFADKEGLGGDFRCYPSYPAQWERVKMGWLRKKFTIPSSWKGQRIQLHFAAVAGDAEIVVNGKSVAKHFGVFLPFDIDITGSVALDKENELCVGVRKASLFDKNGDFGRRTYQAGSFWGQHIVGIWQDVTLVSLPEVRVSDVYVKPLLDFDRLEAEVTVINSGDKEVEVSLEAQAFPWISRAGKTLLTAPLPSSELGSKPALEMSSAGSKIPAHGEVRIDFSASVKKQLKQWSPQDPNLYGLVVQTRLGDRIVDSKYTRFGWRQTSLKKGEFFLNGKPFVMKGDSWHFLGIPQMTRRYPWAWFSALREANLNTVRLHAQPYPSFYLDVADEMGILVLDETAVWASDGGPKLDDPAYWLDTEKHLGELILRDRNHPCILGWSVSNEVMPIVGMMHNPPGMKDTLVKHYGIWAAICRKLDPTRPWISADGEDDGQGMLPTYLIHYGGSETMSQAVKTGKPWGVGEAGNAYYGTPEQVSEANGGRAYESFLGRMEGVAASSYRSLLQQRENRAAYRSVFNMVWYGLKPLPLGLRDLTKPPVLDDGVYFTNFQEGKPGVQPERLGPYCTTLNPGYDSNLPVYEPWPLFDAIRDASAEPPQPCKWTKVNSESLAIPGVQTIASAKVIGGTASHLASDLKRVGVPVTKLDIAKVPSLLFVDGEKPPTPDAKPMIDQVLANGGTVVVWGASPETLGGLNALLPEPLEVTSRTASSLIPVNQDSAISGLTPANLYFSELNPPDIIKRGLAGPLVQKSKVLLKACNTDWLKWNKQPEFAKTAMILRTEREAKPSGAALILKQVGRGRLLVTTLPAAPRLAKAEKAVRMLLSNFGVPLGTGSDPGKALLKGGDIVRTLVCGTFPVQSVTGAAGVNFVDPLSGNVIRAGAKVGDAIWQPMHSEYGETDFTKLNLSGPIEHAAAYLSFWVASPRALDDLLSEPNVPVIGLEVAADDALQVWLNGKLIVENIRTGPIGGGKVSADALKLHQGWNHFLIKVIQGSGEWKFTGRLTCSQPDFLAELESALEKP